MLGALAQATFSGLRMGGRRRGGKLVSSRIAPGASKAAHCLQHAAAQPTPPCTGSNLNYSSQQLGPYQSQYSWTSLKRSLTPVAVVGQERW